MDRRTVLGGILGNIGGATLRGSGVLSRPARAELPPTAAETPACGLPSGYFPDLVVWSHELQKARFYSDLLQGRTVLLQLMSIAGEAAHPVAANLSRVQDALGDRLGRDVFLFSLTVDPERDTPHALAAFAERCGARPGWSFLSGPRATMATLRDRLFMPDTAGGAGGPEEHDCSRGLLRYGNDAAGLWGSVPARSDPRWIAARLSWVQTGSPPAGPPRRKGPLPGGGTR